jgi:nucleoside-diphosphate-sugar epimerase
VLPGDPGGDKLRASSAEVVECDLTAGVDPLRAVVDGVDTIFHLAAVLPGAGVASSTVFDASVLGTFNLLDAAVDRSPSARLVYVSSTAVYGPQLPPAMDPITEEHDVRPTSVYGAAKAAAETFVWAYSRSHGIRPTIIRPTDIVTRSDILAPSGIVGMRFEMDEQEGVIRVPVDDSGRSAELSCSSANDIARGLIATAWNDEAIGGTYHLGASVTVPDEDIARAIARTRGWSVERTISVGPARRWVISAERARVELGIEPGRSVVDLISSEEG